MHPPGKTELNVVVLVPEDIRLTVSQSDNRDFSLCKAKARSSICWVSKFSQEFETEELHFFGARHFRKPVIISSLSASARARCCRCSSSSHCRPPL